MTKPEFEFVMQKLRDEYDPTGVFYGKQRLEKIWEAFRHKSAEWLKRVIDKAFESERAPPLKKELLRIADELAAEDHKREQKAHARAAQEAEAIVDPVAKDAAKAACLAQFTKPKEIA